MTVSKKINYNLTLETFNLIRNYKLGKGWKDRGPRAENSRITPIYIFQENGFVQTYSILKVHSEVNNSIVVFSCTVYFVPAYLNVSYLIINRWYCQDSWYGVSWNLYYLISLFLCILVSLHLLVRIELMSSILPLFIFTLVW